MRLSKCNINLFHLLTTPKPYGFKMIPIKFLLLSETTLMTKILRGGRMHAFLLLQPFLDRWSGLEFPRQPGHVWVSYLRQQHCITSLYDRLILQIASYETLMSVCDWALNYRTRQRSASLPDNESHCNTLWKYINNTTITVNKEDRKSVV